MINSDEMFGKEMRTEKKKSHTVIMTASSVLLFLFIFSSLCIGPTVDPSTSFLTDGKFANINKDVINSTNTSLDDNHIIFFTPPVEGSSVKGVVKIGGVATGWNISSVYLKIDNGDWMEVWNMSMFNMSLAFPGGYRFGANFTYFWDTTNYANGKHTLYARALSSISGYSETRTLNLTVQNPQPQTEKSDNMWLWLGVGFVIGGGLIGAGGILLKRRRGRISGFKDRS